MEKTLGRLEFYKIREMLERMANSQGGRRLAATLVPSNVLRDVTIRLMETEEALTLLRYSQFGFLSELPDIRGELSKAEAQGLLLPESLWGVKKVLEASRYSRGLLGKYGGQNCRQLAGRLVVSEELEDEIATAIDENGEIKDEASSQLRNLRSQMAALRMRVRDALWNFVRSAHNQKFLMDVLVTERNGRYVIPVRQEYRQEVEGIIHDESSSGATVFIEPAFAVEMNNRLRSLEKEEQREIERILRRLSLKVAVVAKELEQSLTALEILDFWLAKARLALSLNAYKPSLNEKGIIKLFKARHPLLGERAVPIDVELGLNFNVLILTGPNTGGKTVTLKTVGLLTLMAMAGLFVPAAPDSELAVFSRVLCDIGDEQSIEQSLSTFSSHMTNIIEILRSADADTLVILDELGAGTDPLEGASLARAIVEKLLEIGAKCIISTHHSELKTMAYQYKGVENASVEFDPETLRPTYEVTIGVPGRSNALEIARNLGLDEEIVAKARAYVPEHEIEINRMLADLEKMKKEVAQEREALREKIKRIEEERAFLRDQKMILAQRYEEKTKRLEDKFESYLKQVKTEAEELLEEMRNRVRKEEAPKWHEIEQLRKEISSKLSTPKIEEEPEKEEVKGDINVGDYVEIKSIRQHGYVLEGPNDAQEVTVQVGIMKLTVKAEDLVVRPSPEEKALRQRYRTYLEKKKTIATEIDLRGMTTDEALEELEKYLEEAYLAGMQKIRIIHGKGTGALRKAVGQYLVLHPYVDKIREGQPHEGGLGVTVASLKST